MKVVGEASTVQSAIVPECQSTITVQSAPGSRFVSRTVHNTTHCTPDCTLHSTLNTPFNTSHCTLHTIHYTLHTKNYKLHTTHFKLKNAHCTPGCKVQWNVRLAPVWIKFECSIHYTYYIVLDYNLIELHCPVLHIQCTTLSLHYTITALHIHLTVLTCSVFS